MVVLEVCNGTAARRRNINLSYTAVRLRRRVAWMFHSFQRCTIPDPTQVKLLPFHFMSTLS
jgi:hypothetical protein